MNRFIVTATRLLLTCALIMCGQALAQTSREELCFVIYNEPICGTLQESYVAIPRATLTTDDSRDFRVYAGKIRHNKRLVNSPEEQRAISLLLGHLGGTDGLFPKPEPIRLGEVEGRLGTWILPNRAFPDGFFTDRGAIGAFSAETEAGAGVVFFNKADRDNPILVTDMVVANAHEPFCGDFETLAREHGLEPVLPLRGSGCRWRCRNLGGIGRKTIEVAAAFADLPEIEYAHPDIRQELRFHGTGPADPYFDRQWYLENKEHPRADINIKAAWATTTGDPGTVIAILDGGFNLAHPELAGRVALNPKELEGQRYLDEDDNKMTDDVQGWNFMDWESDVTRGHAPRHGQAMAGLVAAAANGIGITGVCPDCKILPLSISLDDSLQAEAVYYAAERGADVISMSWGTGSEHTELARAIHSLPNDVTVVAAAGNCGPSRVEFPARLGGVIAVGGSDYRDRPYCMQHAGSEELSLVAPTRRGDPRACQRKAEEVPECDTPDPRGLWTLDWLEFREVGGTSGATALVAGVVGLLLSSEPGLTRDEVYKLLVDSSRKIDVGATMYDEKGYSEHCGFGRIDAGKAMRKLQKLKKKKLKMARKKKRRCRS